MCVCHNCIPESLLHSYTTSRKKKKACDFFQLTMWARSQRSLFPGMVVKKKSCASCSAIASSLYPSILLYEITAKHTDWLQLAGEETAHLVEGVGLYTNRQALESANGPRTNNEIRPSGLPSYAHIDYDLVTLMRSKWICCVQTWNYVTCLLISALQTHSSMPFRAL